MPTRRELANAIRALSMDAVQKANSGHPGAPMGMADIAEVLWNDYMQHNPANPHWPDRDRFVMSNGHGSMLVYSLLHLTGYELPMDELKQFRQLHSKTPGHPEYGYTPGVETTTGPLGQGISNAVGMALAEKMMAAHFNQPGHDIVDHHTYAFLGDGCMMEGISHETCALAGTLGLGKLVAFWDDNGISIDGEVEGWFTDDTPGRFEAYGWHVVRGVDGHDADAVKAAIEEARKETGKPSLICCRTVIGFGSPNKSGKEECHGAALGDDEIALTRKELGWNHAPFEIPNDIYEGWSAKDKGSKVEAEWKERFAAYKQAHPELAAEFERRMAGDLPSDWSEKANAYIKEAVEKAEKVASRKASQNAIAGMAPAVPELLGGSADLAGSNLTMYSGSKGVSKDDAAGNYVYYGVREFGMAAIMNGIALHGGFIPYGGTFLIFSDYARNGIRMSALMKQRVMYVLTHDSIGLGEDGPTHQPIEQTPSLRLIPNLNVWRPCDAVETAVAWKAGIERTDGPSAFILSRQGLPHMERDGEQLANIARGGYILKDCDGTPDLIFIATGSEVELAVKAAEELAGEGKKARVVSMPCVELFEQQDPAYREAVLPAAVRKRVAVEAGATAGWYKFTGLDGAVFGMDRFGESAPGGALFDYFGFKPENVAQIARDVLNG
ncbi:MULTISPECIES: transketolase [unclassified Thioalkalivibrio]|uniref:transketolase n=1 Tax=unclassified Thioalkalivibrio TaxID=2621013 RepID=UPI00035CD077|nr:MULTISPECIES: transketolase [unclassified Thioalkalivibrio]